MIDQPARAQVSATAPPKRPWLLPMLSSLLAITFTSWNIFGYPRLKEDEGQIAAQAWGILHGEGHAALYSLKHMPGATGLLAGWDRFLGMLGAGGELTLVQQGRVLLVLFAAIEAPLLFLIVRRLTRNDLAAFVAVMLLLFSPLQLWYARWLELDPFAAFWTVLALFFALPPSRDRGWWSVPRVLLAGLCLGIAMFSKEVAIAAAPGLVLLCLAWPKGRRLLTTGLFLAAATVVPGGFLVWVAAHGELMQSTTHPSLLTQLLWNTGRNHDAGVFSPGGQFWSVQGGWSDLQPIFTLLSFVAALWLVAFASTRARRALGLMALGYWVIFGSGLIVQDYYVAAALPIWVAAAVVGMWDVVSRNVVRERFSELTPRARAVLATAGIAVALMVPAIPAVARAYSSHDAAVQAQLTLTARQMVPAQAAFVDDGYDTLDLQNSTTLPGHQVPLSCNYFDMWCLRAPNLTTAYVVDNGMLRYLASQDPGSYAGIIDIVKRGKVIWSGHDVNGGDLTLYMATVGGATAH